MRDSLGLKRIRKDECLTRGRRPEAGGRGDGSGNGNILTMSCLETRTLVGWRHLFQRRNARDDVRSDLVWYGSPTC